MKKKTGLLGGTFDPIHKGHVQLAEIGMKHAGLDEVFFIPSKQPPHKDDVRTSFLHRAAMVELALLEKENMFCSTIENQYSGPSYTLTTVCLFDQEFDTMRDVYLIVGADAFMELQSWFSHEELIGRSNFIVINRAGIEDSAIERNAVELGYRKKIKNRWYNRAGKELIYIHECPEDVSSTFLRKMLCGNKNVSKYIPSGVIEYIRVNKLYRGDAEKC